MAHERHAQQQGLETEFLEPTLLAQDRGLEAQLRETVRLAVDERSDAELLRKPPQLAHRCGFLLQVDEMHLDAPLREKPQRGACVGALADTENLHFHAPNIFPATMSPRSKIIAAAVLFSTGGAAIKWCGFGAWQLAACRASIAMLTILILLPEARRGWSWRTAVVGVAYAATTLLYVQANKHTTAASAIFLQSTSPLFILLLAPWLLGEHATRRDIAQMAVMGAGMALFLLGIDRPSATAPNPALGNALAAVCAVTWAFTVMGYRWLAGRGLSVAAAAVSGNAAAATLSFVMAQPLAAGRPADWAVVVFLGVCQLGIPYLFLARAVPQLRALEVGLFLLIEPVLNPIWAWLVHGETPGPTTIAGGVLILGATAGRMILDVKQPMRASITA